MMDPALEMLSAYGPDLRNGLTSHAPMAVEALAALGRADAVMPWLDAYRPGLLPRPIARQRIERDWRAALGHEDRFADWSEFFANEPDDAPCRDAHERRARRRRPAS